jgi:hypothetical protein
LGGSQGIYGRVMCEDMEEGEADPHLTLILEKLAMFQGFVPNRTALCGYFYNTKHVIEDCPDLLKKWEKIRHIATWCMRASKNKKKDRRLMYG